MRRVISLWLPTLATDRLIRTTTLAAWRGRPLATLGTAQGGLRIVAANEAARAAGIIPEQTAADARALCPDLKTVAATPGEDIACLDRLTAWCGRWTPWTVMEGLAADGGGGIWLDVSGCAHLFGGEAALLDDMVSRLAGLGFTALAGLADTPGAAWAACRFGRPAGERAVLVPEGATRQLLTGLPPEALRLPPAVVDTLHRLGLHRIADLLTLPRGPLANRFGEDVAGRLDQFLGRAAEPLAVSRQAPRYQARIAFAEPIGRSEDVRAALDHLLAEVCGRLEGARQGARTLEAICYRVDGTLVRLAIGTAQPVRQPDHLARLFAQNIDRLDAGFGIEAMVLAVPQAEPLGACQLDLTDRRQDQTAAGDLPLLIDRLRQRLGSGNVLRLAPQPRHPPEQAFRPAPPLSGAPMPASPPKAPRPPRLLARPEPVEAEAAIGPPARFRWRRAVVQVVRAEGPERICAEWWHAATPPPASALRDYWRVEDERGQRYWLFREGQRGAWFLHGVFA